MALGWTGEVWCSLSFIFCISFLTFCYDMFLLLQAFWHVCMSDGGSVLFSLRNDGQRWRAWWFPPSWGSSWWNGLEWSSTRQCPKESRRLGLSQPVSASLHLTTCRFLSLSLFLTNNFCLTAVDVEIRTSPGGWSVTSVKLQNLKALSLLLSPMEVHMDKKN